MWDKFSDKTARLVGEKGFFWGFTIASVLWTIAGITGIDKDFSAFTLFLSILAIWLLVFLQNSQNRSQDKFERWLKDDLRNTKQVLELLKEIDKQTDWE